MSPNTIRREANRDLEFGRRLGEARLQAQLSPLQAMRKAANSHWRAAAWMLERADPDHFARRPMPAFRPRQAQALRDDILAILNTEVENPILLKRLRGQIKHLMRYAIDGVVGVERTHRQLRSVLRQIDKLQFEEERRDEAAFDALCEPPPGPTSNTLRRAKAGLPSNPGPRDRQQGDQPLTADVMDKLIEQMRSGGQNGVPKKGPEKEARSSNPDPSPQSQMTNQGPATSGFLELQTCGANSSIFGVRSWQTGLVFQGCHETRCDNERDFWNTESCFARVFQKSKNAAGPSCPACPQAAPGPERWSPDSPTPAPLS